RKQVFMIAHRHTGPQQFTRIVETVSNVPDGSRSDAPNAETYRQKVNDLLIKEKDTISSLREDLERIGRACRKDNRIVTIRVELSPEETHSTLESAEKNYRAILATFQKFKIEDPIDKAKDILLLLEGPGIYYVIPALNPLPRRLGVVGVDDLSLR